MHADTHGVVFRTRQSDRKTSTSFRPDHRSSVANATETSTDLQLLGLHIDNIDRATALDTILQPRPEHRCRLVNFANAHCLNTAQRSPLYRQTLAESDLLLPDGSGVAMGARMTGQTLRENLNGTDLFPDICRLAAQQGLSIYLLGARPGIAAAAAQTMVKRYPALKIAGVQHGYFPSGQTDAMVEKINRSGADLLFVAMGVPQQELWLRDVATRLQTRTALGVGGLFDFYSGRMRRAPLLLRRVGMEWVWRLALEPGRMWRRYVLGNPLFIQRVLNSSMKNEPKAAAYSRMHPFKVAFRRAQAHAAPVWQQRSVRALDCLIAGGVLFALSLPLLLVALLIKLESPGPVLFGQIRIGRNGRRFKFWKFRSMYVDAEQRRRALLDQNEMDGGVLFKMKNDPRVTRVGKIIRRFSIDELPQLWNVLRGDMALVGPRPPLPDEVDQYSLAERQRLLGQPGITCTWQVSGRSEIPFHQQVEMDIEYLHTSGLWQNLKLLARTLPAVLSGRGAY